MLLDEDLVRPQLLLTAAVSTVAALLWSVTVVGSFMPDRFIFRELRDRHERILRHKGKRMWAALRGAVAASSRLNAIAGKGAEESAEERQAPPEPSLLQVYQSMAGQPGAGEGVAGLRSLRSVAMVVVAAGAFKFGAQAGSGPRLEQEARALLGEEPGPASETFSVENPARAEG